MIRFRKENEAEERRLARDCFKEVREVLPAETWRRESGGLGEALPG